MIIINEDMTNLLTLAIEAGVGKAEDPLIGRLRQLALYWTDQLTPMELALVIGKIPDEGVNEGWGKVKALYRARLTKLVGETHGQDTDKGSGVEGGGTDAGAGGDGSGPHDAGGGAPGGDDPGAPGAGGTVH